MYENNAEQPGYIIDMIHGKNQGNLMLKCKKQRLFICPYLTVLEYSFDVICHCTAPIFKNRSLEDNKLDIKLSATVMNLDYGLKEGDQVTIFCNSTPPANTYTLSHSQVKTSTLTFPPASSSM